MISLLDKDYWKEEWTAPDRQDDFFVDWQKTTEVGKWEFMTAGAQLLREKLADGTA